MSTPNKCPHCGAVKVEIDDDWVVYSCESAGLADEFCQTSFCRERAAHAETRVERDFANVAAERLSKRVDELTAQLTREREKWEKLRAWAYDAFSDSERNPIVVDEMNRLDAEAKEGK